MEPGSGGRRRHFAFLDGNLGRNAVHYRHGLLSATCAWPSAFTSRNVTASTSSPTFSTFRLTGSNVYGGESALRPVGGLDVQRGAAFGGVVMRGQFQFALKAELVERGATQAPTGQTKLSQETSRKMGFAKARPFLFWRELSDARDSG